jgi:signal transduction histidine kinase
MVNQELKETQSMMVHSEKMRSLGELVAGIAHEINNPINFIYGNMVHFENYTKDIFELIEKYEKAESLLPEEQKKEIKEYKDEIDIEFLKSDLVDLINSCREGADRTKNIILDLKNFSRLDETTLTQFDIPKEIETTLNILHNKFLKI